MAGARSGADQKEYLSRKVLGEFKGRIWACWRNQWFSAELWLNSSDARGFRMPKSRTVCATCTQERAAFPFTLAFQPIVDLHERRIDGHEALVRGPEGRMPPPYWRS